MAVTAAAVIGAIGLVTSFVGSQKAAADAKKASRIQAHAERQLTAEKIRQLKIEERVIAGETRAGYAGGGVLMDQGSPLAVLAEQAREFGRERGAIQQAGATRASQALAHGSNVASQYRYQGIAQAATGISSLISSYTANKPPPG